MEVTACHLHGRSGVAFVCPHIRDAIKVRTDLPPWHSYRWTKPLRDYVVFRLCASCVQQHKLPLPARTLAEHELEPRDIAAEAMCESCFAASSSEP